MRLPPYLKPGDRIGLTCPARKISMEEVGPAMEIIRSWGFEPVAGKTIGLSKNQFAGSDEERTRDFQHFLNDPSIKAIFACRGGYGTVRMMDRIDYTHFMQQPKWIAGYSDMTILHSHLNTVMGISSLHSSMPINFATNSEEALTSIKDALTGKHLEYKFDTHPLNRPGTVSGEVVGGNLSLIYSLLGTRTGMITTRKILFLEDLDEYLYHIDRMMMSLKRAGKLDHISGLIVGGMSDMKDNEIPFGATAEEIIAEHVREFNFPVAFNFPAGHFQDNRAIVLGKVAVLDVDAGGAVFRQ